MKQVFLLVLLFLIVSCAPTQTPAPSATLTPLASPLAIITTMPSPTNTQMQTPTLFPSPSSTPFSTVTAVPVSMPTPYPSPTPTVQGAWFQVNATNGVAIRRDHSSAPNIIRIMPKGSVGILLDTFIEYDDLWLQVEFTNGTKGWVSLYDSNEQEPLKFSDVAQAIVSKFQLIVTPTRLAGFNAPVVPQCQPTDQDEYTWGNERFNIFSPCAHVEGIVVAVDVPSNGTGDGDAGINLIPDAAYQKYLIMPFYSKPAQVLHVEIVCYVTPGQSNWHDQLGFDACAKNPHPLRGPLPSQGQHVWMEGRWLDDVGHPELHPLYRWGVLH